MSIVPLAKPLTRVFGRTTMRRLVRYFEDWADTAERSAGYWQSVGDEVKIAGSLGEAKAYRNCANETRKLAELVFPEESENE